MTEFNNNIAQMFSQLDSFVTSKTVVGDPIYAGDTTLIPLVEVHLGLGGGSLEGKEAEKVKKGETSVGGLGTKIVPSAVLVVPKDGPVQLVNIKQQDSITKLIDLIPQFAQKFDIMSMFKKKEDKNEEKEIKMEGESNE